jgi:starch synthase
MGRAGRERAIADFDWDAIARRTLEVYAAAERAMPA